MYTLYYTRRGRQFTITGDAQAPDKSTLIGTADSAEELTRFVETINCILTFDRGLADSYSHESFLQEAFVRRRVNLIIR